MEQKILRVNALVEEEIFEMKIYAFNLSHIQLLRILSFDVFSMFRHFVTAREILVMKGTYIR